MYLHIKFGFFLPPLTDWGEHWTFVEYKCMYSFKKELQLVVVTIMIFENNGDLEKIVKFSSVYGENGDDFNSHWT